MNLVRKLEFPYSSFPLFVLLRAGLDVFIVIRIWTVNIMIMVLRLPCKINQASDPLHHLRASRSLTCRSNHNLITTNFSCSIRNSKCHRRPCNDSSSKSLHPNHQFSSDVIHHIYAHCSNLNDVKGRCVKIINYMAKILNLRFNIYTFQLVF